MTVEEWEKTEPNDKLEYVTDFMREIQSKYLFWDMVHGGAHEIVYTEGQYTMEDADPDDRVRYFEEVAFWNGEQLESVNDEHVYYDRDNAMQAAAVIRGNLLKAIGRGTHKELNPAPVWVLAFRHSDSEWGNAYSIEPSVWVNKLGWGVFVRRDLLEPLNMIIHKYECD